MIFTICTIKSETPSKEYFFPYFDEGTTFPEDEIIINQFRCYNLNSNLQLLQVINVEIFPDYHSWIAHCNNNMELLSFVNNPDYQTKLNQIRP